MNYVYRAHAIDADNTLWFFGGKGVVAVSHAFVKFLPRQFHAIVRDAGGGTTAANFLERYIYQHGQVGGRSGCCNPVHRLHFVKVEPPAISLVRRRRIIKPVAHNRLSCTKRRTNHLFHQLISGGGKQEELRFLAELEMLLVE